MLKISDSEFDEICGLMYDKTGVRLSTSKKPLVISRLQKRIQELNLESFGEYAHLVRGNGSNELESFVNAITTNETYFFRHGSHFKFLHDEALPISMKKSPGQIQIWSGACSSGEEPYSIAMSVEEYMTTKHRGMAPLIKINASDINSYVIDIAKKGQYSERSLRQTPEEYKKKYFQSIGSVEDILGEAYQLNSQIIRKVQFKQHNLKQKFHVAEIHIVFLRNVIIYFDQKAKQEVVSNVESRVTDGGYLFISLSEHLNDVQTKFKLIEPGIYRKES